MELLIWIIAYAIVAVGAGWGILSADPWVMNWKRVLRAVAAALIWPLVLIAAIYRRLLT